MSLFEQKRIYSDESPPIVVALLVDDDEPMPQGGEENQLPNTPPSVQGDQVQSVETSPGGNSETVPQAITREDSSQDPIAMITDQAVDDETSRKSTTSMPLQDRPISPEIVSQVQSLEETQRTERPKLAKATLPVQNQPIQEEVQVQSVETNPGGNSEVPQNITREKSSQDSIAMITDQAVDDETSAKSTTSMPLQDQPIQEAKGETTDNHNKPRDSMKLSFDPFAIINRRHDAELQTIIKRRAEEDKCHRAEFEILKKRRIDEDISLKKRHNNEEATVTALVNINKNLQSQIDDKDAKITSMEIAIATKDEEIAAMEKVIKSQDEEILVYSKGFEAMQSLMP